MQALHHRFTGSCNVDALSILQDTANGKLIGKGKEVDAKLSAQAANSAVQRVPLGPGRVHPNNATQATATQRIPLNPIQIPNSDSKVLHRVPVPTDPILVDEEDELDHMEIEVETYPVEPGLQEDIAIEIDETQQVPNSSQAEVETMVEVHHEEPEDDVDLEGEKLVRQWPELATARAERYRKEVNNIREQFHEDPEDDMNMCSEYADEIFQYMTDLEVGLVRLLHQAPEC